MPIFNYKARNGAGMTESGKVEANTVDSAANMLRERNLFIISIAQNRNFNLLVPKVGTGVAFGEVVIFTRQFATMIEAGLSLTQALHLLASQSKVSLAQVLQKVVEDIEGGSGLSDALGRYPKVFDGTYVQLVKAGEASGALDEVLMRLADNMEEQNELQGKIVGAMIYPAVVVVVMIAVFIVMMVMVIPQLTAVFDEMGAELPVATKLLMALSDFMIHFWYILIAGVFGLVCLFRLWLKPVKNQILWDRFLLWLPIFGDLRKKTILTEFTRTMSLLLRTGIPLVDGLDISTKSVKSIVYRNALADTTDKVQKGVSLGKAIGLYKEFPPLVTQMINVGEETGKLDDVLKRVSTYYKQETERAVAGLMSAIEPIIMVILGVAVGFMVFAIIVPINNLADQM
jgi:type IV pilus assembly protein PilC